VFYDPRTGVYRGRDEIDRIAGAIRAAHPDFRYQPIAKPEELGNGGRVQWVSGRPGEAPAYAGTDFIIAGMAGLRPFIFFSTIYPELDSAVRRPLRRIGQRRDECFARSRKLPCSWPRWEVLHGNSRAVGTSEVGRGVPFAGTSCDLQSSSADPSLLAMRTIHRQNYAACEEPQPSVVPRLNRAETLEVAKHQIRPP
jgi:hypothetical protein